MKYLQTIVDVLKHGSNFLGMAFFCVVLLFSGIESVEAQSSYSVESDSLTYTSTTITVSWSAPSNRAVRSGWVGIYKLGDTNTSYYRWEYINSSLNSSSLTFSGVAPGTYEARFFSGSGYSIEATSAAFTVSDSSPNPDSEGGGYSLVSTQSSYSGTVVTVSWSAPSDRTTRSGWIGIFQPTSSDAGYYSWAYINSNLNNGTVTFTAINSGTYEARFFSGSGYSLEAKSATFIVDSSNPDPDPDPDPDPENGGYIISSEQASYTGTTIIVSWSAPSNRAVRSGWVGIYEPNDADSGYYKWKYINGSLNNENLTFSGVAPGTYEARFFSGSGYSLEAKSATFIVDSSNPDPDPDPDPDPEGGEYSLTLSSNTITSGESVTVTFNSPSSSNRAYDWIALYKVGANNQSYQSWKYVGTVASGTLTFPINTIGNYEFRYLKNNSYTVVAVSPTITVSAAVAECPISNLDVITNYPPSSGPIVAFGDSLTAGVGASVGQDYVSQLELLADVSIINTGVSGDTTRKALLRIEDDVLSRNPSTVIVWLGGNDILVRYYDRVVRGLENPTFISLLNAVLNRLGSMVTSAPLIPEDETFSNLETIVRTIQADGAVVILVGFSGEPFDANLESRYLEVAEQTGAIYVPNALSGVIGRPNLMSDLIHPNDSGYAIVAERIYQSLSCVQ